MRIRDIEIDEELAKEIDDLLAQMQEYHIHVARAAFKVRTPAETIKLLKRMGVVASNGKAPNLPNVRQILDRDDVTLLLSLLRRAIARHTIRDAVWAEHQFSKIFERCMTLEPVMTKDGVYTGVLEFDAANANRSVENIIKLKGLGAGEKDKLNDKSGLAVLAEILGRIDQGKSAES